MGRVLRGKRSRQAQIAGFGDAMNGGCSGLSGSKSTSFRSNPTRQLQGGELNALSRRQHTEKLGLGPTGDGRYESGCPQPESWWDLGTWGLLRDAHCSSWYSLFASHDGQVKEMTLIVLSLFLWLMSSGWSRGVTIVPGHARLYAVDLIRVLSSIE